MNGMIFLKYFLACFFLYSLLLLALNTIILGKNWSEIDYMLNFFNAILFSIIIAIVKSKK